MAQPVPTLPGHWLLGSLKDLQAAPLELLERATAEMGDVVRIRFGSANAVLVNHPANVEHILVSNAANYVRGDAFRRAAKLILGDALVVSDGETWKKPRRIINPIFHRQMIDTFAATMVAAAQRLELRWANRDTTAVPLDVSEEMSRLTIDILGHTIFGSEIDAHAEAIIAAEASAARDVFIKMRLPFSAPSFLPTPANLRLRKARAAFENLLRPVVEAARKRRGAGTIASMLLEAHDSENGEALDEKAIFDQLTGLVLGGHETSGNALSWTLYFIAQHPEIEQRLLREYKDVLGGRTPTVDDVAGLVETKKVLNEAMRLRPPSWMLPRMAVREDELAGYTIPRGQVVWYSSWVLHRHPEIWPEPLRFDPDRFSPEQVKERHRFAFIPFGAGQKMCIGSAFAMLEMQLALPILLRGFCFRLPENVAVTPEPFVTLRPRGGLPMFVEPRTEATATRASGQKAAQTLPIR